VEISVPALPRLGALDVLHCVFGEVRSQAAMAGSLVTCSLPEPGKVPAPPPRQGRWSAPCPRAAELD
jgi:hypothetical protein